jgi:hypothetical protein
LRHASGRRKLFLQQESHHRTAHARHRLLDASARHGRTLPRSNRPAELPARNSETRACLAYLTGTSANLPAPNFLHRLLSMKRQKDQQLNDRAGRDISPPLLIALDCLDGQTQSARQLRLGATKQTTDHLHHLCPRLRQGFRDHFFRRCAHTGTLNNRSPARKPQEIRASCAGAQDPGARRLRPDQVKAHGST